jgi:hypothetical protein
MKNITIITGPTESGKTTKAKELAAKFSPDEVVWLEAQSRDFSQDRICFAPCQTNTKLLVIDAVSTEIQIIAYLFFAATGIFVNQKGKAPFLIKPEIILICLSHITEFILTRIKSAYPNNLPIQIIEC